MSGPRYLLQNDLSTLHMTCSPLTTPYSPLRPLRSFDLANGQKSWFKAHQTGTFIKRNTFPQIPGTELVDPKVIVTETGSKLLCDGVWGIVRKPSELLSAVGLDGDLADISRS